MSRDRLSELSLLKKEVNPATDDPPPEDAAQATLVRLPSHRIDMLASMTGFLNELQFVQEEIDKIKSFIDEVELMQRNQLSSTHNEKGGGGGGVLDPEEQQMKLEEKSNAVSSQLRRVKQLLNKLDEANKGVPEGSQDYQIRLGQTATARKRFVDLARGYQQSQQKNREKYQIQLRKEFLIANPDATEEEISKVLNSNAKNVFAQSVLQTSRTGEAKAVLQAVQARHDEVKKIEKTILELNALFQEMAIAVEQQGELINSVEVSMTNTANFMEEGTKELDQAIEYKKSTRKKLYMLCGCCFGMLIIIGMIVFFTVVKPLLAKSSQVKEMVSYAQESLGDAVDSVASVASELTGDDDDDGGGDSKKGAG